MIIKQFFRLVFAIMFWILEWCARLLWLALPIGIHIFLLQLRTKADRLPALTGYFDPDSTWQMVYDGVVLVNTNPGAMFKRANAIQNWCIRTKWYWAILAIIVLLLSLIYIAYKLH